MLIGCHTPPSIIERKRCERLKKLIVNLVKIGISAGIVAYLVANVRSDPSYRMLADQPKDWSLFAAAWALAMTAVSITLTRWFLLVRAIGLPFRLKDAFRLGFLGYLLNFISVGNVGGDLFKAVFIAREQHGRRTEAVATVIIDRMVGMYSLLLVATAGILTTDLDRQLEPRQIQIICQATLAAAALGLC